MARKAKGVSDQVNAATVGYEAELWRMADALRGSMDAAEYKHVVLGLIFLKYISDVFEEQHAKLVADRKSAGGSAGSRQTTSSSRNLRRGQLPRGASRPDQARVHSEVWRFTARVGRIRLLAGTSRRWRNCPGGQAPTLAQRMRPTDRHLRHHHQTSQRGQQPEVGMRNATGISFLPSSLFLRTSPLLANPPFNVSDWGGERLKDDKRWQYGALPDADRSMCP